MKIIDVKAYGLREKPPVNYTWRKGLPPTGEYWESGILRVITDEGIEGIAVAPRAAMTVDLVNRRLKSLLIGKNPLLKERIWADMLEMDRVEELPIMYHGLADIALWDITSKKAGMPLYQLLGGYDNKVRAYASTITYETSTDFLEAADKALEIGYRAIKLHAWGDVRKDAELCRTLRKHVGDQIELMYDGSAGFDLKDSIYLGKALEDAGYLWYEEPMREQNIWNYKRLCDELTIPALAAETSDGMHYNAADFIAFGACDMIRTSANLKGGITGALRIAHLADSFNMKAEIHSSYAPNKQLAAAISNNTFFEIIVFHPKGPFFHFEEVDKEGFITVSDKPGIGYEFDWEEIEKKSFVVSK